MRPIIIWDASFIGGVYHKYCDEFHLCGLSFHTKAMGLDPSIELSFSFYKATFPSLAISSFSSFSTFKIF